MKKKGTEKEKCDYYPLCVESGTCYNPPVVLDFGCKVYREEIKGKKRGGKKDEKKKDKV